MLTWADNNSAGEFQPTLTPYVNGFLYSSKHQTIPLEMPQERAKLSFKVEALWLIPQWIQSNGAKQAWVTEQTISFRSWMCTVLCMREAVRPAVSLKTPATCAELTVHGSYKDFFSYIVVPVIWMSVILHMALLNAGSRLHSLPCVFLSLLHCRLSERPLWVDFAASQSLTFWMFRLCLGSHFASCGTFRGLSLVCGSIWARSSMAWPASCVSQSATIQTSYRSLVLPPKRELLQQSSPIWRVVLSQKLSPD